MEEKIPELERIYQEIIGSEPPPTVFHRGGTVYITEPPLIKMTTSRRKYKEQSDFFEFFWFHEAYHHHEMVNLGYALDEPERETMRIDSYQYYYIPSEARASLFAYRVCVRYGFKLPDFYRSDYFEVISKAYGKEVPSL